MTKITYIPGEIANAAIDEHGNRKPVTRTHNIFDDNKNKNQAEINIDINNSLNQLSNEIDAVNKQDIISVDTLPDVITADPKKIYRVVGDNNYTDYMINSSGDNWKKLATYSFPGIDDKPTAGSNNLVKSGGIANKISELEEEINGKSEVFVSVNSEYITGPNVYGFWLPIDGTYVVRGQKCTIRCADIPNGEYQFSYATTNNSSELSVKKVTAIFVDGIAEFDLYEATINLNYIRVAAQNTNVTASSSLYVISEKIGGLKKDVEDNTYSIENLSTHLADVDNRIEQTEQDVQGIRNNIDNRIKPEIKSLRDYVYGINPVIERFSAEIVSTTGAYGFWLPIDDVNVVRKGKCLIKCIPFGNTTQQFSYATTNDPSQLSSIKITAVFEAGIAELDLKDATANYNYIRVVGTLPITSTDVMELLGNPNAGLTQTIEKNTKSIENLSSQCGDVFAKTITSGGNIDDFKIVSKRLYVSLRNNTSTERNIGIGVWDNSSNKYIVEPLFNKVASNGIKYYLIDISSITISNDVKIRLANAGTEPNFDITVENYDSIRHENHKDIIFNNNVIAVEKDVYDGSIFVGCSLFISNDVIVRNCVFVNSAIKVNDKNSPLANVGIYRNKFVGQSAYIYLDTAVVDSNIIDNDFPISSDEYPDATPKTTGNESRNILARSINGCKIKWNHIHIGRTGIVVLSQNSDRMMWRNGNLPLSSKHNVIANNIIEGVGEEYISFDGTDFYDLAEINDYSVEFVRINTGQDVNNMPSVPQRKFVARVTANLTTKLFNTKAYENNKHIKQFPNLNGLNIIVTKNCKDAELRSLTITGTTATDSDDGLVYSVNGTYRIVFDLPTMYGQFYAMDRTTGQDAELSQTYKEKVLDAIASEWSVGSHVIVTPASTDNIISGNILNGIGTESFGSLSDSGGITLYDVSLRNTINDNILHQRRLWMQNYNIKNIFSSKIKMQAFNTVSNNVFDNAGLALIYSNGSNWNSGVPDPVIPEEDCKFIGNRIIGNIFYGESNVAGMRVMNTEDTLIMGNTSNCYQLENNNNLKLVANSDRKEGDSVYFGNTNVKYDTTDEIYKG